MIKIKEINGCKTDYGSSGNHKYANGCKQDWNCRFQMT
jgi:hypothetical protein